jgi:GAF domain-containing protein
MNDDGQQQTTVSDAVKALARLTLADLSMGAVLEHAALVTREAIPGASEVSVTVQDGRPATVASSGQLALEVDESQYDTDSGPCLDAIRLGQTVLVPDQAKDPRWPEYRRRAVQSGVGSSLSVPLAIDGDATGAFNIYSTRVDAFPPSSVTLAEELAGYAAVILNNAGMYFAAASEVEQMREAMRSRAVIEQAKGIVMGSRRCDADEAFTVLVRVSQQTGQKLHVVARALVEQATTSSV